MQVLKKILKEIDKQKKLCLEIDNGDEFNAGALDMANAIKDIIRKHMNGGWIPVNSHGLPSSSEHDFRFWVTVQYKNGFRRTLKATWNYYNNRFVYQNGKIISEDVVAYRYYSAPKPYQAERSGG